MQPPNFKFDNNNIVNEEIRKAIEESNYIMKRRQEIDGGYTVGRLKYNPQEAMNSNIKAWRDATVKIRNRTINDITPMLYGGRGGGKSNLVEEIRNLPFITNVESMGLRAKIDVGKWREAVEKAEAGLEKIKVEDNEEGDSPAIPVALQRYPIDNVKVIECEDLDGSIPYPVGRSVQLSIRRGKIMAGVLKKNFPRLSMRLICAGSSGAILSTVIATELGDLVLEIIHIKKDGEYSHDMGYGIQSCPLGEDVVNIIVDDFISSGRTINRIYEKFISNNSKTEVDGLIVNGSVSKNTLRDLRLSVIMCGSYHK